MVVWGMFACFSSAAWKFFMLFTTFLAVQILGRKEHTVTKKQRTSCVFDHILFFEFKELSKEQIQAAIVKVPRIALPLFVPAA